MTAQATSPGNARRFRPGRLLRRFSDPAVPVTFGVAIVLWAIAGQFAPDYIVPPVTAVATAMVDIVTNGESLVGLLTTLARVGVGLATSFLAGSLVGLAMGARPQVARYLLPLVRFVQGIPSLSWVVLAVIWFAEVELRVWFIMVVVTLPGFLLQSYDAYRAIPRELREMAQSFRPDKWSLFREVTLPAVTPGIFTAWKVNLGLGIRVVLVAELVGATVGVGAQLLTAQQLFDMTAVVAWTLALGICLLVVQAVTDALETRLLRYRPTPSSRTDTGPPAAAREGA